MELTAYFHRIYGIVPWNPLNFHGINGKNLWHFMNFHNFLLLVYLPSTAMETLKTPFEYSVDFNRGFQGFSMANLEKGKGKTCLYSLFPPISCGNICLFFCSAFLSLNNLTSFIAVIHQTGPPLKIGVSD